MVCDPIHDEGVRMLMEAGFDVDLETSITGPELVERVINFARAANSTIVAEKLIKIFTGD